MGDKDPENIQLRPRVHHRFTDRKLDGGINSAPWDAPPFSVAPSYAVWALFNKHCENELTEETVAKNALASWNKIFPKPRFVAESHGFYTDMSRVAQETKNWEIAKKTHSVHSFLKGASVPIASCAEKRLPVDVPQSVKWEFYKEKTLVDQKTMERTIENHKADKVRYVRGEVQRFRSRDSPEHKSLGDQFLDSSFESDGES